MISLRSLVGPYSLFRRIRHGIDLGVRVAVIDAQARILLVRHGYTPGWHLPGGGVDAGETAEAAARRELLEETNVSATAPLVLHGLFLGAGRGARGHVVCYRVPAFSCGAVPKPNWEITEIGFFPLGTPPEGTTRGTLRRLAELRGEAEISAVW